MPRWILSARHSDLPELMDDPDCNVRRLEHTYAWFARLNPWLARWRALYVRHIRPVLESVEQATILDLGCGGGDVARLMVRLANEDGFTPQILGVDPDERAITYAQRQDNPDGVKFRACRSDQLVAEGTRFDIVLSNHVLHHLNEENVVIFLGHSATLSRRLVLHNDIWRDDLAWLSFVPVALIPAFNSFILIDGLRSVRRAWHPDELLPLLPDGWVARSVAPFRMLVLREESDG